MVQTINLEITVLRWTTGLIDLTSNLKCSPYKRVSPKDYASLDLQINSWGLYVLVTTLLCVHSVTQWISFFCYLSPHGLNVQACLHLNFLAIYTSVFFMSLQQILQPSAWLNAQNQINGVQKSFRLSWSKHPLLIITLASMQGLLLVTPLITIGLYLLDPTLPMFVVTTVFKIESTSFIGGYGTIKWIMVGVLESVLIFFSLLGTFSVSLPCVIFQVAMNAWMTDLRTRTKEAEILVHSDWLLLDKLYRRIRVFSVLCDCFWGPIILPGCTVMLVLASAGSLFCTLRLHGHVHPLVYAFFPTTAAYMIGGALFGGFGQIPQINRNSLDCLKEIVNEGRKLRATWAWNVGDEDMKCVKMKLRAMRPFGVQVGIFGYITASTQFAMLDQIINYVILLLSL